MGDIDVSVVIVNYNTIEFVLNCIRSVIKQTFGINYEIIVVDNNSSDNCCDVLIKEFGDRVICVNLNVNLGFGLANNEAFSIASGRNILCLNPDTILLNNAIKYLSDYLDENKDVGICGGNLFDENMNPSHSYRMFLPSILWEVNDLFHNAIEKIIWKDNRIFNNTLNPLEVGYICGADLMISRNILMDVGLFSEKFFMYFEETELTNRVRKKGYKICSIPYSRIQHLEGKSFATNNKAWLKKREIIEKSKFQYYKICYSDLYIFVSYFIYFIFLGSRILYYFILNNKSGLFRYKSRLQLVFSIIKNDLSNSKL